ncbi:MAG: DUF4190 domain-containing protein [Pseudolysinimonas sp.]
MSDLPPPVPSSVHPTTASAAPMPPGSQPTTPGYGQPVPGYYGPPTNTMAIVSLVLAFVMPLAGAIVGHVALGQIKRTGEGGHGLALAGVIIGWVYTGIIVLILIGYAIFFIWFYNQMSHIPPGTFG